MTGHAPDGPTKAARTAALVRRMIHDGSLGEGDPLPSTRAFAAELGVSRGTVVAAYEQLDGEGYLHLRHGAVARVAATLTARPVAGPAEPGGTPAPSSSDVVDLVPGMPQASLISRNDWGAAWRYAAGRPIADAFPDPAGLPELRAQVANHLGVGRGFAPGPGRVLVTAGTAEALSLLTDALRAGAPSGRPRVAVENPGYRGGSAVVAAGGGELVPVPVDDDGLRLDALRDAHAARAVDAVMVTPSHQYPMGSAMPVARRQELCSWAAGHGVLVIEDDYDSELRHRGSPLPALAALDRGGAVVHVGTFSKVLDPGLRCGFLVLPDGGRWGGAIRAAREARGPAVATVLQHAVTRLLATGALRRHVARCRREYRHRRAMVIEALADVPGVRLRATDGGLHAVVVLEAPRAGLAARLLDRGVRVADLRDYVAPGTIPGLHGLVLGYGSASTPALATALRELRRCLTADR